MRKGRVGAAPMAAVPIPPRWVHEGPGGRPDGPHGEGDGHAGMAEQGPGTRPAPPGARLAAPRAARAQPAARPSRSIHHFFIESEDYSFSYATSSPACHGKTPGRNSRRCIKAI